MDSSVFATPVYRFKDDPIHALILDTLNKKPVNSDHFSLIKRIKLGDYMKRPITTDNLDTVGKRSKEYMNEVGFAYGRLHGKNWANDEIKQGKLRIHAPGPVINKKINEEDQEDVEFNDNFQTKLLTGFQKCKPPPIARDSTIKYSRVRGATTRPTTRISASQRQAREYLHYLNSLNVNEQNYINSQVSQKKKELEDKVEKDAQRRREILNSRGVFPIEFNKERVLSMMPVQMHSQIKVNVEPMVRNAKEIVMKEKIKEWQYNPIVASKDEDTKAEKALRKDRLLDIMEMTISKKAVKSKKKEVSVISSSKQKEKLHWVDRLNKTVTDVMIKCKPDEKISNMSVL